MNEDSEQPQISNPELKLEDVRWRTFSNICYGRGPSTAAPRGYNAELLADAVINKPGAFVRCSREPWIDTTVGSHPDEPWYDVEVKSCVDRYQKQNGEQGRYGMFKIWKPHHEKLLNPTIPAIHDPMYFFVVYTIEDGYEKEVGKLIAPAEMIDSVLDNWSHRDHTTMGVKKRRDISWHLLLKRLGVSQEQFVNADLIDLIHE